MSLKQNDYLTFLLCVWVIFDVIKLNLIKENTVKTMIYPKVAAPTFALTTCVSFLNKIGKIGLKIIIWINKQYWKTSEYILHKDVFYIFFF